MSLRITLVPDCAHAPVPTSSAPTATLAGDTGCEGPSSRDAGARRGRRAAKPVTTTGHAEHPAAPAAPFFPAWDAPLQTLLEVPASRTEPICLRPVVTRTSAPSEETRIGAPIPPTRPSTRPPTRRSSAPEERSLDATVVCKNPIMRPPVPDEEGRTLVRLAPPIVATHAMTTDASSTTEAGTVICKNPLLRVPELAPVAVPGATAVFLGRLGDARADDRTPIFVPEGESLEVGSKRGSPFARDPFVARYHAALVPMTEGVLVEDFGTANGVYVRAETRVPLRDDDRLRIGRQLLRFLRFDEAATGTEDSVRRVGSPDPGAWGRLAIMLDAHREAAAYPLRTDIVELGQQTGDVQFPCDPSIGEPHCRLVRGDDGPAVHVEPNGPATYVRVDRGDIVPYGSELLIGETRVRLDRDG